MRYLQRSLCALVVAFGIQNFFIDSLIYSGFLFILAGSCLGLANTPLRRAITPTCILIFFLSIGATVFGPVNPSTALCLSVFTLTMIRYNALPEGEPIGWFETLILGSNVVLMWEAAILAVIQNSSNPNFRPYLASFTAMKSRNAMIFICLGLAVLVTAIHHRQKKKLYANEKSSAYVLAAFITFAVVLSQFVTRAEVKGLFTSNRTQAQFLETQIRDELNEQILSITRMAKRLEYVDPPTERAWKSDAIAYHTHMLGMQNLAVLKVDGSVKWSYPLSEKSVIVPVEMLAKAAQSTDHFVSPLTPDALNHQVSKIFIPLRSHERVTGYLLVNMHFGAFLRSILGSQGYESSVKENGSEIFSTVVEAPDYISRWGTRHFAEIEGMSWEIDIVPTPKTLANADSKIPFLILCLGSGAAYVFATLMHLMMDRRRKGKIIEDQRRFLDTIIHNLPMAVTCKDVNDGYRYILWNKKCEQIYGVATQQAIGKTDFEFQFNTDAEARLQQDQNTIRSRGLERTDEKITRDGNAVYLSTYRIPLYDHYGRPEYILEIAEDTTEQKKIEKALRESERRFLAFMENSPAIAWIKNENGDFVYANEQFKRVFHRPSKSIVGIRSSDLVEEKYAREALEEDTLVLRSNMPRQAIREVKMANGAILQWLVVKFPLHQPGEVKQLGAIAFDVTERIEMESQLNETKDALKALIDFSPLPIMTLDLQGLVKIWNPACERIFGWKERDLLDKPLPFVPDELRTESNLMIRHILESKQPIQREARRLTKRGSLIDVSIAAMCLTDGQGQSYGLMAIVDDISQRKAVERALNEARVQAEKAADAKSEFLANISHEIRTPLNGVIGMTDLLTDTKLDEEQKRYVDIVHNSGLNLLTLINDILDLSKIEAGKLKMETTEFALIAVVEGQADLFAATARQKGLTVTTFIDPSIATQNFMGDPGRLSQVLSNLIGNAIKFTAKGGIYISAKPVDDSIRFEIRDQGIGISKDAVTKLFKPFSQAEASTTRRFGGTGLGLSICKNLVEMMGGRIGVESEIGKGSTFWFSAKLPKALSPSIPLHKNIGHDLSRIRVMVADSDSIACEVIHDYCLSWGMRNGHTSDFKNVLRILESESQKNDPYDLLILGQEGEEETLRLAHEISQRLGDRAPKIILTQHFESNTRNFEVFVNKPVKQSQLFDGIMKSFFEEVSKAAKVEDTKTTPAEVKPTHTGRILVVDDVNVNQMLALKLLDKMGYSAVAVANGKEALEAVQLQPYSLVLMDCQMPEMDGFEATRRIRQLADPKVAAIPIIALTANAMESDAKRCLEAGMNDYLSKPIKKEKLAEKVELYLKHGNQG